MKQLICRHRWFSFLLISLIGVFTVKLLALQVIGDADFEPDSYLHFLQAQTVFTEFPRNLVIGLSVWAKPLYTYIHGIWLSLFGEPRLIHGEILNLLISTVNSVLVFAIARKLRLHPRYAYLAAVLSSIGFLVFRSSISTLTEPVFNLFLLTAVYLWVSGRYGLSGLVIGLSVLGRLEAVIFVGVWWLMYVANHKFDIRPFTRLGLQNWSYAIWMALPAGIWNLLGFLQTGRPLYLISNGYPTTAGVYGYGYPLTYVEGLLAQEGIVTLLIMLGAFMWLGNRMRHPNGVLTTFRNLYNSGWGFIVINLIVFVVVQSILFTFGLFGTAGLMRYFVIVMPLMCILVAWTVAQIADKFSWNRWLSLVCILCICLAQGLLSVSFLREGGYYKGLINRPSVPAGWVEVMQESSVQEHIRAGGRIFANRPELVYYAGIDLNTASHSVNVADAKPGDLVVLEQIWLEALGGKSFAEFDSFDKPNLSRDYPGLLVFYWR